MPPVMAMLAARRWSSSWSLFLSSRTERPASPSWTWERPACLTWATRSAVSLGWRDQLQTPMVWLLMIMVSLFLWVMALDGSDSTGVGVGGVMNHTLQTEDHGQRGTVAHATRHKCHVLFSSG